jgi:hypothetical protein
MVTRGSSTLFVQWLSESTRLRKSYPLASLNPGNHDPLEGALEFDQEVHQDARGKPKEVGRRV